MQELKLNNSPITYFVSNNGHQEWILLIHAAYVNYNMFRTQIDYFKTKYNIIALDIIGHGKSTDTQKGDTIENMSDWIHEILEIQYIDKIHVLGISLGSLLAQDLANKYPEKVKSLACFGGYDINNFNAKAAKENNANQLLMIIKALISIPWFAKSNKKVSAYTLEAQEEFYQMNIQFPKQSMRLLASLQNLINKHETGYRQYQLLIGCGEYDIPSEIELVNEWKRNEPSAQVKIFENAGHCVNMDVPIEFNKFMEAFWIRCSKEFDKEEEKILIL